MFELEREFKETSKHRFDLENECRSLDTELNRENEEYYNNTMHIDKDLEFTKLNNERHEKEQELNKKLIEDKKLEILKQKDDRAKVQ